MSYPKNKRERFLIGKRKGKKRSDLYWDNYCSLDISSKLEYREKLRQLRRNTTKLCSCYMCGNPRRYFGELTLQERKHIASG